MNLKSQMIAFLFVGMINTLFGYTCYAIFIYLGMQYAFALLLSTIFGVLFNFKTIGGFVFNSNDNSLIFKFIAVYVFLYLFNVSLITLIKLITENLYLSGFLALIPSAMLGFVLNKRLVFKNAY